MPGRFRILLSVALAATAFAAASTVVVGVATPEPAWAAVRYKDVLFPGAPTVTSNLVYGSAPNVDGVPTSLLLDLYRPAGDAATNRAAIVWVHGGGFSTGTKTATNAVKYTTYFSQLGYVNASIDYRLRPSLDCDFHAISAECEAAARDAQHDTQAAVRWLRANAATYGVDPARIIVAGHSAGAMAAMNANFNAGDPGASGTPEQPSTVLAGVSLAGCAVPTSLVGASEPPSLLVHALQDPVVPYSCPQATYNAAVAAGDVSKIVGRTSTKHGLTNDVVTFGPIVRDFLYNKVLAPPPPTPALSVSDVSVTEGNSGTKTATFTVSLSAASTANVTVAYATANGSATAPSDYTAKSGTLTFTAGQTSKTVAVTVNGDTAVEGNETFALNLSSPAGATVADGSGTGTIVDNDAPVGRTLTIADVSKVEGGPGTSTTVLLTVRLSSTNTVATTFSWSTANGSAVAGSDYTAKSNTVNIPAGSLTKQINVTITGDGTVEANETFLVNLTSATNATIADGQAVVTITNDD